MFTVTASRRGRKPIVATFATREAADSAAKSWGKYFAVSIREGK